MSIVKICWKPVVASCYHRIPEKAHITDAGWDVFVDEMIIQPGQVKSAHTNIRIQIPIGWMALLLPRTSTERKLGLRIRTIVYDAGYTGEIFVTAYNPGFEQITIPRGVRPAQLIFLPVPYIMWAQEELPETERNDNGFGSSGP